MTSVNVTTQKNTVTVQQGDATTVTVTTQGAQGATGAGVTAGDKGALTVAANLTDWTLNDSVVTNAKVSASAAIAGTKISPDFGSQNITTTGNAVFGGNLTVSGTTTTIDTTTLTVEDKNIELGKVGSPTDITADGGGITLLGDTNHTFNWLNATDSWTSSEHIALPDNKKLQLGTGQDLQVFWDGSSGFVTNQGGGNLHFNSDTVLIKNAANTKSYIRAYNNSSVELYHNNVKRCETSADGLDLPDNTKLQFGDSQDLQIFHNGSHSVINDAGTGMLKLLSSTINFKNTADNKTCATFSPATSCNLFFNGSKKFETTSLGITVTKEIKIEGAAVNDFESGRIRFNETDSDFNGGYIHYDGSANILKLGVHPFNDAVVGNDVDCIEMKRTAGSENVELNFAGSKKCETTSSGITVQGSVTTEDMNMSNLNGTANEVDGSKGSWSIQEGADDLFIINRVSGKKYKFNLTEIS